MILSNDQWCQSMPIAYCHFAVESVPDPLQSSELIPFDTTWCKILYNFFAQMSLGSDVVWLVPE